MRYPNIYGEGQLFAFSAIEGNSFFSDDCTGILLKEKVGIKFYYKDTRNLFNNHDSEKCRFEIVSSDYIDYTYLDKRYVFLYLKAHVIVGLSDEIQIEGKFKEYKKDNISYQTSNGMVSALKTSNGKFIFVVAKNKKEANKLINENENYDLNAIISKRISFLDNNIKDRFINEQLAYKCLSVMKTQLYSKEGLYKTIWSTPDRLPHKRMWLWDSIFHSIGFRHIDSNIAQDLILSIFVHQTKDGFIPHMMDPKKGSKITQPPIIMYGALKVFEINKDLGFLKKVYEHNKKFLNWVHNNRRYTDLYLYSWNVTSKVNCRCDESGMDNSPRFDGDDRLYAIDFSCFMANETRLMSQVSSMLNLKEDEKFFREFNEKIVNDINEYLYSKEDNFYFDYNIDKKQSHKVYSVSSFLPLFAKAANEKQAQSLLDYLNNEKYFKCELMIPSIAKIDSTFGQDMWRGPVWINYNYLILDGLYNYQFNDYANDIKKQMIKVMEDTYLKTGVIFEFYDPMNKVLPMKLNRKGLPVEPYDFKVKMQTIRDFGWSTTLLLDMLHR